jgi:hypothetical protein
VVGRCSAGTAPAAVSVMGPKMGLRRGVHLGRAGYGPEMVLAPMEKSKR